MSEINTEFMLLKTSDFYTSCKTNEELVSGKCFSDNIKKKAIQKKLFSVLFKLSAPSFENIRKTLQAVGISKDSLK